MKSVFHLAYHVAQSELALPFLSQDFGLYRRKRQRNLFLAELSYKKLMVRVLLI